MADPHVLTALRRKYAVLLGEYRHTQRQSVRLKSDMLHVAAVIRMYRQDESVRLIAPIKPAPPRVAKGSIWARTARELLRDADRPMTTREIAWHVADTCGVPADRTKARKDIQCSLYGVLRRDGGRTIKRHDGKPMRWSVDWG